MKIIALTLFLTSCLTATVHRDEWLACCQLCDRPRNMDYVTKAVYEAEVFCHCLGGKEYELNIR